MSATTGQSGAAAVRSFRVEFPEDALEDLRRRIAAVRWPTPELVEDRSQGVQLPRSASRSAEDYDFGRLEYLDRGIAH